MQKYRPAHQTNQILPLLLVFAIVVLDRLTKIYFLQALIAGESIPIVKDIFHFTLVFNTGIAFGLFKNQGVVFVVIPIVVVCGVTYYLFRHRNDADLKRFTVVALSLILAGALGNLIDRIKYGHVIDFIDFRIWPVFNVADSAITIGITLILWQYLRTSVKT